MTEETALLTQREFDSWRTDDATFKTEIRQFLVMQTALNLQSGERLSVLETNQEKCAENVSRRTTWVSAVVSAIVGGLFGWLAK